MLQIELSEFNGDNRQLRKNLSNIVTRNCEIYGENTLLSPSFLLDYDDSLLNKNYVYVPAWDRYYYIVSPLSMIQGKRCVVVCSEDVRMTFANGILSLECYVVRNQRKCNTLVIDDYYPAEIMSTLCTLKFNASPFYPLNSDRNIVMAVYGGSNNSSSLVD